MRQLIPDVRSGLVVIVTGFGMITRTSHLWHLASHAHASSMLKSVDNKFSTEMFIYHYSLFDMLLF